jgi:hypothetical protein
VHIDTQAEVLSGSLNEAQGWTEMADVYKKVATVMHIE